MSLPFENTGSQKKSFYFRIRCLTVELRVTLYIAHLFFWHTAEMFFFFFFLSITDTVVANGDVEAEAEPAATPPEKLLILDARSYAAAVANRAKGGGCECPGTG